MSGFFAGFAALRDDTQALFLLVWALYLGGFGREFLAVFAEQWAARPTPAVVEPEPEPVVTPDDAPARMVWWAPEDHARALDDGHAAEEAA